MSNLTVENVYTRQAAKTLTKKNFWRLLGMMLVTGLIIFGLAFGGIALLVYLTGAEYTTTVQSYSYSASIAPDSMTPAFLGGYTLLMLVVSLLGTGLNLGLIRSITDIARDTEKVPVGRVFSRMKYFLKGWGLNLWVVFKTMLWALPGVLVMMVAAVFIVTSAQAEAATITSAESVTYMVMSMLPLLMMLLIFALVIPAALRYFLSTYVLADEPFTGVFECVRESKAMMKGHKWQLFKLTIPYLLKLYGWMFLIVLVMSLVLSVTQQAPSDAAQIISVVVMIAAYVLLLVKMLTYALRSQVACGLFYLKRKGETPAIPPEEEERIVAWQPAAEKTAPASVATGDDHIACWKPGGEDKPEQE